MFSTPSHEVPFALRHGRKIKFSTGIVPTFRIRCLGEYGCGAVLHTLCCLPSFVVCHPLWHNYYPVHFAETLGDFYIRGLPLPRIPLYRELKPDDRQTVSVQLVAERTPRARLTRLLNGNMKIMRGLE